MPGERGLNGRVRGNVVNVGIGGHISTHQAAPHTHQTFDSVSLKPDAEGTQGMANIEKLVGWTDRERPSLSPPSMIE